MRTVMTDLVGGSLKALALAVVWLAISSQLRDKADPYRAFEHFSYESTALTSEGELLRLRATHSISAKTQREFFDLAGQPVEAPAHTASAVHVPGETELPPFVTDLGRSPGSGERWFAVIEPHRRGWGLVAYGKAETPEARRRVAFYDRRGFADTPPGRGDWLPLPPDGQCTSLLAQTEPMYSPENPKPVHVWLLLGDTAQELWLTDRRVGERVTLAGARGVSARPVDWYRPGGPAPADSDYRLADRYPDTAVVLRAADELLLHVAGHGPDHHLALPPPVRGRSFGLFRLAGDRYAAARTGESQPDGRVTEDYWWFTPAGEVLRHESLVLHRSTVTGRAPETGLLLAVNGPVPPPLRQVAREAFHRYDRREPLGDTLRLSWQPGRTGVWRWWLIVAALLSGHVLLTEGLRRRRQWHWALLTLAWGGPGWLVWFLARPRRTLPARRSAVPLPSLARARSPLGAMMRKELAALATPATIILAAGLLMLTWREVIHEAAGAAEASAYARCSLTAANSLALLFMVVAGLVFGSAQTLTETRAGTWYWLWARPLTRRRIAAAKVAVGLGLTLLSVALPLAAADLWCRWPGHWPAPYFGSQLAQGWQALLGAPVVYAGAVLAGVRYQRVFSVWPLALVASTLLGCGAASLGQAGAWAWLALPIAVLAVWTAAHAVTTLDVE
jgi:hypothetical protein